MLQFKCPKCQKALSAPEDKGGIAVMCPGCNSQMTIPSATMPTAVVQQSIPVAVLPQPMQLLTQSTYCRNCGKPVGKDAVACLSCGLAPYSGSKYCPACGAEPNPGAIICVKCGVSLQSGNKQRAITSKPSPAAYATGAGPGSKQVFPSDPPKDPVIMCILSILLPGLGEIILGQTVKGLVILGVTLLTLCSAWPITLIVSTIDTYKIAVKLKEGNSVDEWEWF